MPQPGRQRRAGEQHPGAGAGPHEVDLRIGQRFVGQRQCDSIRCWLAFGEEGGPQRQEGVLAQRPGADRGVGAGQGQAKRAAVHQARPPDVARRPAAQAGGQEQAAERVADVRPARRGRGEGQLLDAGEYLIHGERLIGRRQHVGDGLGQGVGHGGTSEGALLRFSMSASRSASAASRAASQRSPLRNGHSPWRAARQAAGIASSP